MRFDLKKYLSMGASPSEKRFTADFSQRDFSGAHILSPVDACLTAERDLGEVRLHLEAAATVSGECARCLDPVAEQATVSVDWTVRERDLDDPDFDLPLDETGALDVDEWLYQEFLFQIPPVLLCSADCLGLCPVCGKKRQDCTCPQAVESTSADARLSILKSLLN